MMFKRLVVAVGMLIAGAAAAQTPPQQNQMQINDAWARATPGKAENGAAYLTIVSPVPDRLTGVSTPIAKKAELHNMTIEGGVMKMRPLSEVDIPAGQPVTLKPGGTHIMLTGLNRQLKLGEQFPLTLSFEKSGTREVEVAVEKAGAMGPESHSGAGMSMPPNH